MQKIPVVFIVAVFMIYGCASTSISKKGTTEDLDAAIGTWDYLVRDTPNGDMKGSIVLSMEEGGAVRGRLTTEMGDIALEDVEIVGGTLSCSFQAQGYEFRMKGSFAETSFEGKVFIEYYEYPLTATKRR